MTTIARCTHCDATFKVKDHLVGKAVRCPRCNQAFRIQEKQSAAVSFSCKSDLSEPETAEPPPGQSTPTAAADDDFFSTKEDPNAVYQSNVALARDRKMKRQLIIMISVGVIAALILIGGTVVAVNYAYQNTELDWELAELNDIDVATLQGDWRPVIDSRLQYQVNMPGKPEVATAEDGNVVTVEYTDPELGQFFFEIRKETHDEWNETFAKLDRKEIFSNVQGGNLMQIRSEATNWVDSIAAHRYFLTSQDVRITKTVTVVQKFSVDGKTITALWSGKRSRLRSPEVYHFFTSIEINRKRYILR